MILNDTIPNKLDAIKRHVEKNGSYISKPFSSVDTWELVDIRAMMTDAGYGVKIVSPTLNVWGEHGSGRSGFLQGSEQDIDNLLIQLGIA